MDGSVKSGLEGVLSPTYKLGRRIGIGTFGKVKIAEHVLTGHKVAIKILKLTKIKNMGMEETGVNLAIISINKREVLVALSTSVWHELGGGYMDGFLRKVVTVSTERSLIFGAVRREIKISRLFMHPHIIRLYEVIETTTKIFIVTEYAEYGDLFDYIVQKRRLKEDEARKLFQQIISGVEYCHRCMVVHRDLNPENLLLDSNFNVKIADFGFSNIMRDGHFLKTSCGSPNYAAPEIVSGKLYAGPEVDAWSCGVILYALLSGTLPFEDESFHNLYKKIKAGCYTLPRHLSAGARDLISRIIVVDPMKRLTIPEIRQHPWFQAHLPIYLAVPRPDTTQQAKKVDEEILQEVVRMGFEKNHLVESLRNRVQNEGTVAYYLLLDNRFGVPSGYLGAEFQETMETTSFNPPNPIEAAAPGVGHSLPGYTDNQAMDLRSPERKWALGLQSGGQPFQIMMEVLKALQAINVRWKNIGHYNMKCRWLPSFIPGLNNNHYFGDDESTVIENSGVTKSPNVVKFQLQLYKTEEEKYVVDVQRLEGPQFLFLDVCAAFLQHLRAL